MNHNSCLEFETCIIMHKSQLVGYAAKNCIIALSQGPTAMTRRSWKPTAKTCPEQIHPKPQMIDHCCSRRSDWKLPWIGGLFWALIRCWAKWWKTMHAPPVGLALMQEASPVSLQHKLSIEIWQHHMTKYEESAVDLGVLHDRWNLQVVHSQVV